MADEVSALYVTLRSEVAGFVRGMGESRTASKLVEDQVVRTQAAIQKAAAAQALAATEAQKAAASQRLAIAQANGAIDLQIAKQRELAASAASTAEAQSAAFTKARNAAALVGVAVAAVSVKLASDYSASLTKVQALTGATSAETADLSKKILALAPTVGIGPKALADALYFVESGGFHGAAALDIVTESAKAAAAGLGDAQTVAFTLVSALTAYKNQGLQAKAATDLLVGAVTEGHVPADQLASALGRVIGVSASLGVSYKELLANIAALTRTGQSAEQAATSIQAVETALVRMLNPSKQVKGALDFLGISGQQLNDELGSKGLRATLQTIIDSTTHAAHNSNEYKQALVTLFPNVRALRDVLGTAGVQGKAYNDILNALTASTEGAGRTQQAFATTQKSAAQQYRELKASIEVLLIQLGNALLPTLARVMAFFTQHTTLLKALAIVIGTTLVAAMISFTASVWANTAALLANPIGLVIAAIGGLTIALIAAYKHSETFRNIVNTVWISVQSIAIPIINAIRIAIDTLRVAVGEVGPAFSTAFSVAAAVVAGAVGPILGPLGTIANAVHAVLGSLSILANYRGLSGHGTPYEDLLGIDAKTKALRTAAAGGVGAGVAGGGSRSPDFDTRTAVSTHPVAAVASALAGLPSYGGAGNPADLQTAGGGGGGGSGSTAAAGGPYSAFRNVLTAFGSKEQTAFTRQAELSTLAQVAAAEKADRAMKTLAESHLRHAQTLVKTANNAKNKAAATSLAKTAQSQVNALTVQLTKVQKDGVKIAADQAQAAVTLKNAQLEATSNMADAATAAAVKVTEAKNQLDLDKKGTLAYYQDLIAYNQAVADQAAQATAAAAQAKQDQIALQNAIVQAGIDYSDPLSALRAAVTEAQNTLSGDTAGTTQFYLDTAALHQAQQQLADALAQNTTATATNTAAMTGGGPLNQLPSYLALRAGANSEAYLGGSGAGGGGGVSARNGGATAPIYININVQTNDADAIAKALNVRLSRAGSRVRL